MKMVSEITSSATEDILKLRRKVFSAVVMQTELKERSGCNNPDIKTGVKDKKAKGKRLLQTDLNPASTAARQEKRWGVALMHLVEP